MRPWPLFSFLGTTVDAAISNSRQHQSPLGYFGNEPKGLKAAQVFKVPGNNPLNFCNEPSTYTLKIAAIDIAPNPPVPGQSITITAGGTLSEPVTKGTARLTVKFSFITLFTEDIDLCEITEQVELQCPLAEGSVNFTKVFDIPAIAPAGTYRVKTDVYAADHDQVITCLDGSITL